MFTFEMCGSLPCDDGLLVFAVASGDSVSVFVACDCSLTCAGVFVVEPEPIDRLSESVESCFCSTRILFSVSKQLNATPDDADDADDCSS